MQFGTTDAKGRKNSGQSILEFLLMLPMLVGITFMMVRVSSAIQVSIVNQQYARAQALWLAFNSPIYPALKFRVNSDGAQDIFVEAGVNQMIIGVSGNLAPDSGDYAPEASTQLIVRPGQTDVGSNEPSAEPNERGNIRVRTTVSLCTQVNQVPSGSRYKPAYEMAEVPIFPDPGLICRSPYDE